MKILSHDSLGHTETDALIQRVGIAETSRRRESRTHRKSEAHKVEIELGELKKMSSRRLRPARPWS